MYCSKCGKETQEGTIFCFSCGTKILSTSDENTQAISEKSEAKNIIKCGNCEYVGKGESARRIISVIMAWLCIFFAPLITIIYFGLTSKYKCPKCHSNFVGVKNKKGIYVNQKKSGLFIILVVLIMVAVVGMLSTLAVVSLNNAREKSRDAKRVSDIKQVQTALELYYADNSSYPKGESIILGMSSAKTLTSLGFEATSYGITGITYMGILPMNPEPGGIDYSYSAYGDQYRTSCADELDACTYYEIIFSTEGAVGNLQTGLHYADPQGVE